MWPYQSVCVGHTVHDLLHQLVFVYTDKSADEAGRIAAKLKALHRNTPLKRDSTLWYAGLYDGCFVVVEGLSLRAARRPTASEDPEFVTLDVPLGAVVFRTTESADSLTGAISDLMLDYVPDDATREDMMRQIRHRRRRRLRASGGAGAPRDAKETLGPSRACSASSAPFTCCTTASCTRVRLSVPCPAWNRDSQLVVVYFLEQVSTTLHNHHTALGLDGFVETAAGHGDAGQRPSVARVFVYRRMLRLRLRDFLRRRETLNGGGVELDAKARLALWVVSRGTANDLFLKMYPKRARVIRKCASRRASCRRGSRVATPRRCRTSTRCSVLVPVRGLARHRLACDLLDAAERGPESAGDAPVPAEALRVCGASRRMRGRSTETAAFVEQRHGRRRLPRFGLACVVAWRLMVRIGWGPSTGSPGASGR